jgi:hypothetical protein
VECGGEGARADGPGSHPLPHWISRDESGMVGGGKAEGGGRRDCGSCRPRGVSGGSIQVK